MISTAFWPIWKLKVHTSTGNCIVSLRIDTLDIEKYMGCSDTVNIDKPYTMFTQKPTL